MVFCAITPFLYSVAAEKKNSSHCARGGQQPSRIVRSIRFVRGPKGLDIPTRTADRCERIIFSNGPCTRDVYVCLRRWTFWFYVFALLSKGRSGSVTTTTFLDSDRDEKRLIYWISVRRGLFISESANTFFPRRSRKSWSPSNPTRFTFR